MSKLRKRKGKLLSCVHVLNKMWKACVVCVQRPQKMYKKAWCTRRVVVLLIYKPIAFLPFSLPSPTAVVVPYPLKIPRRPATATELETSLRKWIRVLSISIAIILTRLLCQMPQANSCGAEFLSSEVETRFRRSLLTSSTKREIRHFLVVVVRWQQRNVQ